MLFRDEVIGLNANKAKNLIRSEITSLLKVPTSNKHQELFYEFYNVKNLKQLISHMVKYRRTVPLNNANRNILNKYTNMARSYYNVTNMTNLRRNKSKSHPMGRRNKPVRR